MSEAWTIEAIRTEICDVVQARLSEVGSIAGISDDLTLEAMGLSSLDLIKVVLDVESRFTLSIPDDELSPQNFSTVASICHLIGNLITQRASET